MANICFSILSNTFLNGNLNWGYDSVAQYLHSASFNLLEHPQLPQMIFKSRMMVHTSSNSGSQKPYIRNDTSTILRTFLDNLHCCHNTLYQYLYHVLRCTSKKSKHGRSDFEVYFISVTTRKIQFCLHLFHKKGILSQFE